MKRLIVILAILFMVTGCETVGHSYSYSYLHSYSDFRVSGYHGYYNPYYRYPVYSVRYNHYVRPVVIVQSRHNNHRGFYNRKRNKKLR